MSGGLGGDDGGLALHHLAEDLCGDIDGALGILVAELVEVPGLDLGGQLQHVAEGDHLGLFSLVFLKSLPQCLPLMNHSI